MRFFFLGYLHFDILHICMILYCFSQSSSASLSKECALGMNGDHLVQGAVSHQMPLRFLAEFAKCVIKTADAIRRTFPFIKLLLRRNGFQMLSQTSYRVLHILQNLSLKIDTKWCIPCFWVRGPGLKLSCPFKE